MFIAILQYNLASVGACFMDHDRLLLVAGDSVERMMLEARLRGAGFDVTSAAGAERALPLLAAQPFALLVTTLLLPGADGVALLREARAHDPELEVILLTAVATIESLIAAVDYGACAYLCLPLGPGVLEARVRAAIERRQLRLTRATVLRQLGAQILRVAEPERTAYGAAPAPPRPLRVGPLELDPTRRRAALDARPLTLSRGEFELLLYLALRDNQIVSVEQIAREALGIPRCSLREARDLVKARVHRLRRKIEPDPQAPALIVSVRGSGYMLVTPPSVP
jgi:DNA-binding response OmpR family regulator